jgi:hypothetical protein
MNDVIPEVLNGETMGVKFNKWLERDPKQNVGSETYKWAIGYFGIEISTLI